MNRKFNKRRNYGRRKNESFSNRRNLKESYGDFSIYEFFKDIESEIEGDWTDDDIDSCIWNEIERYTTYLADCYNILVSMNVTGWDDCDYDIKDIYSLARWVLEDEAFNSRYNDFIDIRDSLANE